MTKSLEQFRKWALATKSVANPDGSYLGECVSLVQQYLYQVFEIPFAARGDAKDFIPPTFSRVIGTTKPGDIIRYGADHGGGYGHVGLIDDRGKWLDQNNIKALTVGEDTKPSGGYESIWRPTRAFKVKASAADSATDGYGVGIDMLPKGFIGYMNRQGFTPVPQEPENYLTSDGTIAKRSPVWVRDSIMLSDEAARDLVEVITARRKA